MTTEAIVFMLGVWGVVLTATSYCFYRLLTSKRQLGGDEEKS